MDRIEKLCSDLPSEFDFDHSRSISSNILTFFLSWCRSVSVNRPYLFSWCRSVSVNRLYLLSWCLSVSVNRLYILSWCRFVCKNDQYQRKMTNINEKRTISTEKQP